VGSAIAIRGHDGPIVSELWLFNRSIAQARGRNGSDHASVLRNSNMNDPAGQIEDSRRFHVIVLHTLGVADAEPIGTFGPGDRQTVDPPTVVPRLAETQPRGRC